MKIVQLINLHRFRGGADLVAQNTARMLAKRGHQSAILARDSRDIGNGLAGKARAFVSGLYSASGRRLVAEMLERGRPDLVHVHDVYPLFSPWVLRDIARAGVALVMTCHDYRLICPGATHLCGREVCEACRGGREYWCVMKNCRASRFESLAYATRTALARNRRLFIDNIDAYITPTEFVKRKFVEAGFPEDRITAAGYALDIPADPVDCSRNAYAAYVGRFSPEKGIDILIEAAAMTGISLRLAGDFNPMPELCRKAPPNARFLGELARAELNAHYRGARFLVFPSIWFETFGLVAAEAMSHGVPVVASNLGAIPELVDDGVTGLLFDPGNAQDLADKMRRLWEDPGLCARMGRAGHDTIVRRFTEQTYYDRLMLVYEQALQARRARP